jgi:hypothetical protein
MHSYLHSSTLVIVNNVTKIMQAIVETVEALTPERGCKLSFASPDHVQYWCVSSVLVTFPLCFLLNT